MPTTGKAEAWGKDLRAALGFATPGRMPSPLRWKIVVRDGKLAIRIFSMPHQLPADSKKTMPDAELASAWDKVVATLDASTVVQRFATGERA